MEDNPYKAPATNRDDRKLGSLQSKSLLILCIAMTGLRTLMLAAGAIRVLPFPDRRENLAAVAVLIVWPTVAVAVWALSATALWRGMRLRAAVGLALCCDLIALSLVQSPIEL